MRMSALKCHQEKIIILLRKVWVNTIKYPRCGKIPVYVRPPKVRPDFNKCMIQPPTGLSGHKLTTSYPQSIPRTLISTYYYLNGVWIWFQNNLLDSKRSQHQREFFVGSWHRRGETWLFRWRTRYDNSRDMQNYLYYYI